MSLRNGKKTPWAQFQVRKKKRVGLLPPRPDEISRRTRGANAMRLDKNMGTTFLGCQAPPVFLARVQCLAFISGISMKEAILRSLESFMIRAEAEIDRKGVRKGYEILLSHKAIALNVSVDEIKQGCDAVFRKLDRRMERAKSRRKEYHAIMESLSK